MFSSYRVNEIFYSLQGEGHHAGRAALFVRFSGCNLRCPFCDTDFGSYREMTALEIADALAALSDRCRFVVLTGGEPTLQADTQLTALLHERGYFLAMETNGTRPVPTGVDWVTCSPKSPFVEKKPASPEHEASPKNDTSSAARLAIDRCDELKLVFDGSLTPTDFGLRVQHLYLQPCDTGDPVRNRQILSQLVAYVKAHPQWAVSLQQHKIMDIR